MERKKKVNKKIFFFFFIKKKKGFVFFYEIKENKNNFSNPPSFLLKEVDCNLFLFVNRKDYNQSRFKQKSREEGKRKRKEK